MDLQQKVLHSWEIPLQREAIQLSSAFCCPSSSAQLHCLPEHQASDTARNCCCLRVPWPSIQANGMVLLESADMFSLVVAACKLTGECFSHHRDPQLFPAEKAPPSQCKQQGRGAHCPDPLALDGHGCTESKGSPVVVGRLLASSQEQSQDYCCHCLGFLACFPYLRVQPKQRGLVATSGNPPPLPC